MSAGLYIHIPFCRSRCDYCSFVSCVDTSKAEAYYNRLREQAYSTDYSGDFDTVYFGGGTPSAVPELIEKTYGLLRRTFSISDSSEITVECNPDSVDEGLLSALKKINCNRVSLGLQSADDDLLRAVGRRHDYAQFLSAVNKIKTVTDNISVDVMLGLPGQGVQSVIDTLKRVCDLRVKHISVYALKVEDGTPLKARGYFPDEDIQADMYDAAYETLKGLGFCRYEVSNFCLPGFESRHNLKYWNLEDYLGLGAAAHSFYGGKRYEGVGLEEYLCGIQPLGSDVTEELDQELIMLSLRTCRGLQLSRLKSEKEFMQTNRKKINDYIREGMLELKNGFLRLSDKAFYVMNSIIVDLI